MIANMWRSSRLDSRRDCLAHRCPNISSRREGKEDRRKEDVNFEGVSKGWNKGLFTMTAISAIDIIIKFVYKMINSGDKLSIRTHRVHIFVLLSLDWLQTVGFPFFPRSFLFFLRSVVVVGHPFFVFRSVSKRVQLGAQRKAMKWNDAEAAVFIV